LSQTADDEVYVTKCKNDKLWLKQEKVCKPLNGMIFLEESYSGEDH